MPMLIRAMCITYNDEAVLHTMEMEVISLVLFDISVSIRTNDAIRNSQQLERALSQWFHPVDYNEALYNSQLYGALISVRTHVPYSFK